MKQTSSYEPVSGCVGKEYAFGLLGLDCQVKIYRSYRISELGGAHKDHRVQLLSEWPTQGLNTQSRYY